MTSAVAAPGLWSRARLPSWHSARQVTGFVVLRLLGFAFLFGLWSAAATQFLAVQLPRPELVWQTLRDNFSNAQELSFQGLSGGYWSNVVYSVTNAFAAFLVGSTVGFLVGSFAGRLQWVRSASAPLLLLFGTVPDLVAAPFLLIWLGPGRSAQFVIVSFYCFVVVGIAAQNAALRLSPRYEECAATLGAPRRARLGLVLRAGLPSVIGAVRVALATAWGLQAIGELLGSQQGVGRVVVLSQQLSNTAGSMAVICLIGAVAVCIDAIVTFALRWFCRWQEVVGI